MGTLQATEYLHTIANNEALDGTLLSLLVNKAISQGYLSPDDSCGTWTMALMLDLGMRPGKRYGVRAVAKLLQDKSHEELYFCKLTPDIASPAKEGG